MRGTRAGLCAAAPLFSFLRDEGGEQGGTKGCARRAIKLHRQWDAGAAHRRGRSGGDVRAAATPPRDTTKRPVGRPTAVAAAGAGGWNPRALVSPRSGRGCSPLRCCQVAAAGEGLNPRALVKRPHALVVAVLLGLRCCQRAMQRRGGMGGNATTAGTASGTVPCAPPCHLRSRSGF